MRKIYMCLALALCLVSFQAKSQVDITVNVDMNAVSPQTGGSDGPVILVGAFYSTQGSFSGATNTIISLTDADLDGIWTGVVPAADRGVFIFQVNYWTGTKYQITFDIPSGCWTGTNNGRYQMDNPNITATFDMVLGECMESTWNGSWDKEPFDGNTLNFTEDYNEVADLSPGVLNITAGKSVTIPSGSSLNVRSTAVIGSTSNVPAPLDNDFEDGMVPTELILEGDDNASITTSTANGGTQSLELSQGSSDGYFFYEFTIPSDGDYNFSLYRSATTWSRAKITTTAIRNNANLDPVMWQTNVGLAWSEYTDTRSLTAGTYYIEFYTAAATLYIDDIKIERAVEEGGSLTIESGASFKATSAFDREVTFKRNTTFGDTQRKYSLVGIPIAQNSNYTGADLGSDVYKYDETAPPGGTTWVDASSDVLIPGYGYSQTSQEEIAFTGFPNVDTVTLSGLTRTTTGIPSVDNQGWHLLSNPYGAAISVASFLEVNSTNSSSVENSISIWDDGNGINGGEGNGGDYFTANSIATVNESASGRDFDGYIGSMQGFIVKTQSDDVDVVFTADMAVLDNNADATFFRKANSSTQGVKLSLSSSSNAAFNELFVGLIDDASLGYDAQYDATKLIGNGAIQFYSLIDDSKFAIQAFPPIAGSTTELAFDSKITGEITLSVEELTLTDINARLILFDKETNTTYDLSEINQFTFEATEGKDQNRFTLTYEPFILSSSSDISKAPSYSYANNNLNVLFDSELKIDEIAVYSVNGTVIETIDMEGKAYTSLNVPVSTQGINIVKIVTSEGVFTQKFIF